jgi:formate hydrogenlyase subunit 4
MLDTVLVEGLLVGIIQTLVVLSVAPLLLGITKKVKARLQYRRGASVLQPYWDLAKWWSKAPLESDRATPLSSLAPALVFGAFLVASLLVPIVTVRPPLAGWGDLVVVIGLLALSRFVLALSALDPGSAFGGIGSSREVAIAALVEPGLVLALVGPAVAAGSTDLGVIAARAMAAGANWYTPAILLAGAASAIVLMAETGHEPFDNPDTHLELTMVHEAMLLEASGPRLAVLTYAGEIKLIVVGGLFVAAFLPFGAATEIAPLPLLLGTAAAVVKLVTLAVGLGLVDGLLAKLRILAIPELLSIATGLAIAGFATRLWLTA